MAQGNDGAGERAGRQFAAFISYSHADAAIAAKLQRRLERYRLPKHVRQSKPGLQSGIGRIFRDREDLAAAVNLSDAIRAALAESETLVVICSPEAAASAWVAAEIALFRTLHPDRPVLAALIRGEPATAFPAALTEGNREPLAADLRAEGDGFALGFLKIVAGIVDVPLDTLVQRDAQRRIRRVTIVTLGALAAMIVMGVMTTFAIQARNEAARQRASAEGLVEYMLTDLREKLKGVGRLEVQDTVNEKAMEYYANQGSLDDLSAESVARRARVLHAMGEDYEIAGDLGKATAKFEEAHRATEKLIEKEPTNATWILTHGKSEYWRGYSLQKRADFKGAELAYQNYLAMAKRAAAIENKNYEAMREQGWAHNALGVINFKHLQKPDAAKQHFQSYAGIFAKIWKARPDDREALHSLADSNGWLADVNMSQSDYDDAFSHRKRQMHLLDQLLATDPKNDQYRWAKVAAERAIFRICFRQERLECARRSISNSRNLLASREFDPANREWIWQSAYVALDSGFLAAKSGQFAAARKELDTGLAFARRYREKSQGDRDSIQKLEKTAAALADRLP